MQFISIIILFTPVLHQTVYGNHFDNFLSDIQPNSEGYAINITSEENPNTKNETSGFDGSATEFQNDSLSSYAIPNATFTELNQNSTSDTKQPTQSSVHPTANMSTSSTSTVISSDESHPPISSPASGNLSISSLSSSTEAESEEPEGVARGRPNTTEIVMNATTPGIGTMYEKALELINDTYTLSILLPITAGVVFATTILLIIAMCRCLRRRCRRRRFHRKTLPDTVKHLRPSDRARLLAESSDEEF